MKIALVQPPPQTVRQAHDVDAYPSLALGYLAAVLERAGYDDLLVIDGRFENLTTEAVVRDLVAFRPALLGITAKTHEVGQAARIASAVKQQAPDVVVALGGCHVTAEPQATMEQFPDFDCAVVGEGEEVFVDLARSVQSSRRPADLPGLVWRDGSRIRQTSPAPPIEPLDALPFPAWHRFRKQRHSYMVFGSRGCPFRCKFCMRVLGSRPRLRSPENILAEIDWLVDRFDIRAFDFEDETFGLRRHHAMQVCRLLAERSYPRRLVWSANLRADLVDEELLRAMRDAGCERVAYGVEAGDPDILRATGKGITLEQVHRAFALTHKVGLESVGLFILGHPGETWSTALATVRLATQLNPTSISVGIMVPYPGTEIREMALRGEGGYRLRNEDWAAYDKYLGDALEIQGLSRRRLESLQAWAYLRFYLFNGRIRDLLKFSARHARAATHLARKLVRGR